MTQESKTPEESWQEVGRQFEALGESLAEAFRAAWESEQAQQHLHSLETGLERMADEFNRAAEEARTSPEAQQLQQEAERAVESARVAGRKTLDDARPHLLSALQQINSALEGAIRRIEEGQPPADEEPGTGD